jgi:hypothetical protein
MARMTDSAALAALDEAIRITDRKTDWMDSLKAAREYIASRLGLPVAPRFELGGIGSVGLRDGEVAARLSPGKSTAPVMYGNTDLSQAISADLLAATKERGDEGNCPKVVAAYTVPLFDSSAPQSSPVIVASPSRQHPRWFFEAHWDGRHFVTVDPIYGKATPEQPGSAVQGEEAAALLRMFRALVYAGGPTTIARHGVERGSEAWVDDVRAGMLVIERRFHPERFDDYTQPPAPAAEQDYEAIVRKVADGVMEQREEVLRAFVAKYGFQPDEAVQVISSDGSWRVIRREDMYAAQPEARGVEGMVPNMPGNWPEDASHENGDYECACARCGATFYGHKRRVVCKVCAMRAEQRKLQAWVGDMKTSAGMDYYVCVGYSADRGDYLTPHSYKIRGRAEYDVAGWNHLLGNGPEPDILAFDTDLSAEQPEGKGTDGIDTTMFRQEWRRDCQGKEDYDAELVSLSCRYYPANYRADNKHSVNASIVCGRAQHTFISREFSADTPADAKKLAEEWVRGQITFVAVTMTKAFAEQGEMP